MPLPSFVEYALELLGGLGPLTARSMMGGYIVKCGDLPVALIAHERLYLKADAVAAVEFRRAGGEPFTPVMRGKPTPMSYWSPPDDALDSPEAMRPWAERAVAAAARAAQPRGRARPPAKAKGRTRATAKAKRKRTRLA